jgi:hypothetical protein
VLSKLTLSYPFSLSTQWTQVCVTNCHRLLTPVGWWGCCCWLLAKWDKMSHVWYKYKESRNLSGWIYLKYLWLRTHRDNPINFFSSDSCWKERSTCTNYHRGNIHNYSETIFAHYYAVYLPFWNMMCSFAWSPGMVTFIILRDGM